MGQTHPGSDQAQENVKKQDGEKVQAWHLPQGVTQQDRFERVQVQSFRN